MAYDARQVVNWFIQRSAQDSKALSIMSLLKLTYIAHGWYLETRKEPLINNRIEAWQHGPVIPDVYHAFRPQGVTPNQLLRNFNIPENEKDIRFLDEIYNLYSSMSPFKLSDLTHVTEGPWDVAKRIGGNYAEIPNSLIRDHYIMKREESNKLKEALS